MARVLILSLVFPPDSVSTAQIMGQLASDLQKAGHSVTVLTTMPHYHRDLQAEVAQPIRPFWGRLLQRSCYGTIPVYHAHMPLKSGHLLLRLLAWLSFHAISLVAAIFVVERPQIILAPSPPLTIGLCAWLIGLWHRVPYIYNVQEIYPDMAIALGVLRNRWLIRAAFALERLVYRRAERITVIAPRMRERLVEKGVSPKKVVLIPNFVDLAELKPLPKDNHFSRKHGLTEFFVVSYAGNLGPAQGLEGIIRAAEILRQNRFIHFLILGDGIHRQSLQALVDELRLPNLLFLPYQPFEIMSQVYSASNLSLVSLASNIGSDAIPSKVYRIMACARPVLAVVDGNSDLARFVQDVGCGWLVPPDSPDMLAETILDASCDPQEWCRRGLLGCVHVQDNYARPNVTARYEQLIRHITGDRAAFNY